MTSTSKRKELSDLLWLSLVGAYMILDVLWRIFLDVWDRASLAVYGFVDNAMYNFKFKMNAGKRETALQKLGESDSELL